MPASLQMIPPIREVPFLCRLTMRRWRDAFQRARVKEGEPIFWSAAGAGWDLPESVLERCNHTLEELNLLAYKLIQMTERQIEVYEGVLKSLPERNMKQVINGLYNLERFEFLSGSDATMTSGR